MGKAKSTRVVSGSRVLVIPDLHAPFIHKDALAFTCAIRDRFNTDTTVFLGDEIDSHAVSNYASDPDGDSPGIELEKAVIELKRWMKEYPEALLCVSNHTMRPWIKMQGAGLPKRLQPKLREVLDAPEGWKWAEHWRVGKVVFEHGDGVTGGKYPYARAMELNMVSTVIGHHHGAFGVHWHRTPHHVLFGMGLGCLIDESAYAFAYGRRHKTKPILGAGVVLEGQPVLVKMQLNDAGRWNRKIIPEFPKEKDAK